MTLAEVYRASGKDSSDSHVQMALGGDWRAVDARGLLLYRLYRFCNALHALFASNYHNWLASKGRPAAISEYVYILRDVTQLLAPEAEVSGERKLATASRMSGSYVCLSISPVAAT